MTPTVRKIFLTGLVAMILALPVVVSISYYALKKLSFAGEDRIAYGKSQVLLVTEIRKELLKRPDIKEVSFTSSNNLTLSGLLIKRDHARSNVLLCHGYKSTKELMYGCIDIFPDSNLLLFDFRAHGQSDGTMTSIGCNEAYDVIAGAKFLKTQIPIQMPLIILGISMGGAATIKAVEKEPDLCNALIIDSAYASLSATTLKAFSTKSGLPHYPFFPLIKFMFHYFAECNMHDMNPVESVQYIKQPIFFIHSCTDGFISPKSAVMLFAQASHKQSKIWIGPSCRHGWLHTYHTELYRSKVDKFLKSVIKYS